ncbi:pinin isoform X2 [Ischnura elegans]|nr:pinin isoform X2 [Ischnura elegans]
MGDGDSAEEEDPTARPAVPSRVIATPRDTKSRQEVLAAQSADSQSKARNRRMFGALLGTLQKFQQEETRMRDKEEKRAKVEKKLEEAARREREELRRERQELFLDRKRKQAEIRKIELKILRIKEQDEWEAKHRYLLNFIQTRTKPHIFYLPKIPCARSEERLLASQKAVARMIEKKREDVHAELGAIEKRAQWRQGLVDAGEDGQRGWGGNGMGLRGGMLRRGRRRMRPSMGARLQAMESKEEGEVEEDDDWDRSMDHDFEGMDEDDDDILGTIPSVASTVIRPGAGDTSMTLESVVEKQPVQEVEEEMEASESCIPMMEQVSQVADLPTVESSPVENQDAETVTPVEVKEEPMESEIIKVERDPIEVQVDGKSEPIADAEPPEEEFQPACE